MSKKFLSDTVQTLTALLVVVGYSLFLSDTHKISGNYLYISTIFFCAGQTVELFQARYRGSFEKLFLYISSFLGLVFILIFLFYRQILDLFNPG